VLMMDEKPFRYGKHLSATRKTLEILIKYRPSGKQALVCPSPCTFGVSVPKIRF